MSSEEEAAAEDMCCASCGVSAIDDIKLKDCDGGCDLMKYCSDNCQEIHGEQHEEECEKRSAEIRDRDLFTIPNENHHGECPICCLPLPLDPKKSTLMSCCSQLICNGCDYANQNREIQAGLKQRCAFCREELPETREELIKLTLKRVKKNDPVAMRGMGRQCIDEGDYETAFKHFKKAARLGDVVAHCNLSVMYRDEEGVEKSKEKEMYHLEQAAIGGHHMARHSLGCKEAENRDFDRARKHWIIAANLGFHESLNNIKILYKDGHTSKEDYAYALRAYQAAVEATKSPEREEAEAAIKSGKCGYSS